MAPTDNDRHPGRFVESMQFPGRAPLRPRPLPKAMPHLERYLTDRRDRQAVAVMTLSRSKATIATYDRCFRRIDEYLHERNLNLSQICSELLEDYLIVLELSEVNYSYLATIKGSMTFLALAMSLPDLWSARIERQYEGCLRAAAAQKPPAKKSRALPAQAIAEACRRFILPYLHNPKRIPLVHFRAIAIVICQQLLLARLADLLLIRAGDVRRTTLNGFKALCFTFRTSKVIKFC